MLVLETVKDFAIVLGGVVGLTTFLTGVLEYARQNHQRRADGFLQTRRRFLETPEFQEILRLLADDAPGLAKVPVQDRRNFLGFLEEVALMVNSRLIRVEVAGYMFGYYVRLADQSEHLWTGLDRGDRYWTVFRGFAARMRRFEAERSAKSLPLKF